MGQTTMGRVEYAHEDMVGLEAELQEQLYDANRRNDALTKRIEGLRNEITRMHDLIGVVDCKSYSLRRIVDDYIHYRQQIRAIAENALENDDKEAK